MVKRSFFQSKRRIHFRDIHNTIYILCNIVLYLAQRKTSIGSLVNVIENQFGNIFASVLFTFYFVYFCMPVRHMGNHLKTMCPVSPSFLRNVCFDCIWCRSICFKNKIKRICLLYWRISALEIFQLSMLLTSSMDVRFHNLILPVHLSGSLNQVFT